MEDGASLICLAEKVTENVIYAKTVTSQFAFEFDRTTGIANWEDDGRHVSRTIDSIAALTPEVHALMLELKDKYSPPVEGPRLTVDQKRALLFAAWFPPAHPIDVPWETKSLGRMARTEGPIEDHQLSLEEIQERLLVAFLISAARS